jgi:hypothetical protein
MLFAARAQASEVAGGAVAAPGQAVQLPEPAASVVAAQTASPSGGAIARTVLASVGGLTSPGGSAPEAPASGEGATGGSSGSASGAGVPAPGAPGKSTPAGERAASGEGEAGEAVPGAGAQSHEASTAKNSVPEDSSAAAASQQRPAGVDANATAAAVKPVASTQRDDTASGSATATGRERQAETLLRSWPSAPSAAGADAALAFTPDLQRLMAQFRSLAGDISASSVAEATVNLARAAAQELVRVLVDPSAPSPDTPGGSVLSPRGAWNLIPSALFSAQRLSELGSSEARLDAAKRAVQKTSVATSTAASPTVASWLPSAAGAAFGSGMTGAAVPAAALLAVVAVCLLGTWLPRRLADDGLACKSALLNLRLERPG